MEELLQPLVRGDRRADPDSRRAGELRRRLLAEQAEQVGRALEVGAGRRRREREEAHHEADHDRVDTGLRERDPGGHAERRVDDAAPHAEPNGEPDHEDDARRDQQRGHVHAARVRGRDHDQRDDVVDDREGQHERPQPHREARADERQQAERERRVGRHRDPPAVSRRPPGVQGEVDQRPGRQSRRARPASGSANLRRSRSSPRSNSRRASSPTTKKKKVISPLFTQ